MRHVFVAYARDNDQQMKEVRAVIKGNGLTVRTDEDLKRHDEDWQLTIEKMIDSSVAVFVLLSPSAKNSPWVRREIRYSRAQEKKVFLVIVEGEEKTAVPLSEINANYTSFVGLDERERKERILSIVKEIDA